MIAVPVDCVQRGVSTKWVKYDTYDTDIALKNWQISVSLVYRIETKN